MLRPNAGSLEGLSTILAEYLADGSFTLGTHVILISPSLQRPYLEGGWAAEDLTRFKDGSIAGSPRSHAAVETLLNLR